MCMNMKCARNKSWFPIVSVHINISKLISGLKWPLFSSPLTYMQCSFQRMRIYLGLYFNHSLLSLKLWTTNFIPFLRIQIVNKLNRGHCVFNILQLHVSVSTQRCTYRVLPSAETDPPSTQTEQRSWLPSHNFSKNNLWQCVSMSYQNGKREIHTSNLWNQSHFRLPWCWINEACTEVDTSKRRIMENWIASKNDLHHPAEHEQL